jgi:hypothetical protein
VREQEKKARARERKSVRLIERLHGEGGGGEEQRIDFVVDNSIMDNPIQVSYVD